MTRYKQKTVYSPDPVQGTRVVYCAVDLDSEEYRENYDSIFDQIDSGELLAEDFIETSQLARLVEE